MNLLTAVLKDLPEYQSLREAVENGQVACLSGLGTVHRAHILSALRQDTGRPLAIVCQDEETARRTIRELQSFSKEVPAFLPTRELTLYDASTVSRGWEQKRLRVLYGLGQGKIPVLVTSVEALMLRTVPRQTLFSATLLQAGAEYTLDELAARLTDAGYARTPMVEGVGQFSLRGGILDVFSRPRTRPSAANSSETLSTPWATLTP